ncbi:short-chain dehydrogenase, partial [Streptomyces griseoincarnatus]
MAVPGARHLRAKHGNATRGESSRGHAEGAARTEKEFGRVDGVVHLVGGWRGCSTFTETDLADWDTLHRLLVRTVQH